MGTPEVKKIEEYLLDNMVELRAYYKTMDKYGSREEVVGALVRSYSFIYQPGEFTCNGKACFEFAPGRSSEFDVTVVILTEDEGENTANRIVKLTSKFDDCPDAVAQVHFSTYCDKINRYIVVYEKFSPFPFNEARIGKFFINDGKDLSAKWITMIRSLVEMLYHGRKRAVRHGDLGRRESYVLVSGRLKVINVGRYEASGTPMKDIEDFTSFIKNDIYFDVSKNFEWLSFDLLLGSDRVKYQYPQDPTWKDDALGHPILLSSAKEKIKAYTETCAIVKDFNMQLKCLFGNQLAQKYGKFTQADVQGMDAKQAKVKRDAHFRTNFDMQDCLFDGLFNYDQETLKLSAVPHYGGFIHLEVIHVVRNTIYHGKKHLQKLDKPEEMVKVIRGKPFGSYMSTAYTLSHMLEQDLGKDLPPSVPYNP